MHDILPMRVNLASRMSLINQTCFRCELTKEIVFMLLENVPWHKIFDNIFFGIGMMIVYMEHRYRFGFSTY